MSRFKSFVRIPSYQCARDAMQKMTSILDYQIVSKSYPWCNKFCKDFCIKDATDYCTEENDSFCRINCQKFCYHVGPVPKR